MPSHPKARPLLPPPRPLTDSRSPTPPITVSSAEIAPRIVIATAQTARAAGSNATPPPGNLIVLTSACGGVGTTTLMTLIGLVLKARDVGCALMDADLDGGGLSVLLGIEHEPGPSLQDLDAPLGHIEGSALNQELPHWEGMSVLASAPWRGRTPDWWEIEAAALALGESNDVVLVDAGRGRVLEEVPSLARMPGIVVAELSVLGMARTKAHLSRLARLAQATGHEAHARGSGLEGTVGAGAGNTGNTNSTAGMARGSPVIVGAEPLGAPRRSASDALATAEAIAYLDDDVLGPLRRTPALCADTLAGLGVRAVPRRNRRVVAAIAERIMEEIGLAGAS